MFHQILGAMLAMGSQQPCGYTKTMVCNEWQVQNQVVSLEQWGSRIISVRCENPSDCIENRRWIITYED